jgi:type II secretory pathway pseudopilin PulG
MNGIRKSAGKSQKGMTLIEATVAMLVLTIGVTAVAAVFARGIQYMGGSQDDLLARIKAEEAVESVFAARDDQTLTWAQIRNVLGGTGADGGVFIDGPLPVNDPGPDGLVNTADDQPGTLEYILLPGPDGIFGTADDVKVPLAKFQREIQIRDVPSVTGGVLRSLTVIMTYNSNGITRTYTIVTYISQYS